MRDSPLVSIIINNYNYGRFLKEAINSALDQSYENFEVIIVDDGSTDESRDIINSFGSRVIHIFKSNGGQASAYNSGYLKSKGRMICNFDSDDTLLPDAISKGVASFDDDTIKVQWPLFVTDKDGIKTGEITTKWTPPEGDLKDMILQNGPFYDFHLTTGGIVKKEFLDEVLPMPEEPYKIGSDEYLVTLAPLFGKIKNINEALGTYRSHGNNHYMGTSIDETRIRMYITRFDYSCRMLQEQASRLGFKAHPELWKKNNFNYLWPNRLLQAKRDLELLVPEGLSYILVDQNECADFLRDSERYIKAFVEKDGSYNGLPPDDATAIAELERLKKDDAGYIIFWWTSFWVLEHYKRFYKYIQNSYNCVLANDRLIAYDLRAEKASN